MKFSLHLAKYYNAVYNSAPDPYTYGVDEIVKRIGLQLGAIEDVENFGEKYEGIVIAKVISCEKHPDADKLIKMTVDTGIDERTIVSGIAEHYKPEDIIGKQVSVLINLAPRKIRGIESQGMILMAENNEGSLAFVSPEKVIDNGGEVR